MKETARLVIVLTLICLVAAVLLAWVNNLTAEPIARALRAEKLDAITRVLPPHENEPDRDTVTVEHAGQRWTFFLARSGGRYAGCAFESASQQGYGGSIRVMTGLAPDGSVNGIVILAHKETPGLGAKIEEPAFQEQFAGLSVADTTWSVRKDGGDIDAITAATISSRAVVGAIRTGLDVYAGHREEIIASAPPAEGEAP